MLAIVFEQKSVMFGDVGFRKVFSSSSRLVFLIGMLTDGSDFAEFLFSGAIVLIFNDIYVRVRHS